MADYCTLADIKAQLPESGLASSTDYDDMLQTNITAVSRLIDREVGRWPNFFYPSTSDETRVFDGNGDHKLWIDDVVSITSVSISDDGSLSSSDYAALSSSDYYAWPYNHTATGQPIMRLDLDWRNGAENEWPDYEKSVKIAGVFGYSTTPPADIKQACIIQTGRWFMRAKQAWADAGASAITGQLFYVQRLDPDVAEILSPYKLAGIVP